MLKTRVIPVILTDGLSQVKGNKFDSWRTVGSVLSAARVFSARDVDELVLLDVAATASNSAVNLELVSNLAEFLRIPFAVGGGIRKLQDVENILKNGADKVIIGTALVEVPNLIEQAANEFGSQAIVCSIDSGCDGGNYTFTRSGKMRQELSALDLAQHAEELGAGELLLQSTQRDGTLSGFDLESIMKLSEVCSIPIIASGGAGTYHDLYQAIAAGANAVCAGAMFQFTPHTPAGARDFLSERGVSVRK
jgi:cyclase